MHPQNPPLKDQPTKHALSNIGTFDNQIIVLIMPEENYLDNLIRILGDMTKIPGKICYVSLNRPYSSLISSFRKANIDVENIHFIDAITRTAQISLPETNCEFVASPGSLTELSVTISRVMESKDYRYLVFDSISTLLVYESDTTIAKFVHYLMARIRVIGCNAVFTCLKQDAESILIKDINMFADKVIHMEKWHLNI